MTSVLLIDDEQIYSKMITPVLVKHGYELSYAKNGNEGLSSLNVSIPDIIILDIRLPDMTGFDVIKILKVDPRFENIPVIIVSGQEELDDKLKAFDLGADDYLAKPFQPEELVARLGILARRAQVMKVAKKDKTEVDITSTMIAVHSLRGGVGCSTIAVNLALAFYKIWKKRTLLVDTVLAAGQVAMMIDASPDVTWEDLVGIEASAVDAEVIRQIAGLHTSGIRYIASPRYPVALESFGDGFWQAVTDEIRHAHDYIIADTPHDFSDISIHMLDNANHILLVLAPEMASLRAAICSLNIFNKLGYPNEKIKITLNHNLRDTGIKHTQIEKALGKPINLVIPYGSQKVSRAIDYGTPYILKNPDTPLSATLEDVAYVLSNPLHKNIPPISPTQTWKKVTGRSSGKKKN